MHADAHSKASRNLGIAAAALLGIGAAVSFAGWAAGITRLSDWWGVGITIKANAAIAFFCAAVGLGVAATRPSARWVVRFFGALTALIAGLTLAEHLFDLDLRIDTLLFDEPRGALGTAAPGRMGPPAAMSLLALGISLILLNGSKRAREWSVGLALLALGIGTLSATGYAYGAESMYTIPRLTGIALQTALMVVLLSCAVLAILPGREPMRSITEEGTVGVLARRLLPIAFLTPLLIGWIRIQGQRAGLYDYAFGAALRTLLEIALFSALLWWVLQAIRARELERQRLEEERRSGEQRLRQVVDASAVPFNILTPARDDRGAIVDFLWTYANEAAAAALRVPAHALIGRTLAEIRPGDWNAPHLLEHYMAVADRAEVRTFELHSQANGVEEWFEGIASPFEGNVAVWFADVTERKHHEFELREADRRKDEFVATLAHELRNPLAPIRQASVLARNPKLAEAQRRWAFEVIERQVQHMALLLDDLLDVSRMTRGNLELRKNPTALDALIAASIETARPVIEGKRHHLSVRMENGSTLLNIDPLRMSQVVSNLLNNAAKYTNEGGKISLTANVHDGNLEIQVTDNGIGLAHDNLTSIFEMFSQVKSARERSEGGLGIGLALTKGLVALHGGIIRADSRGLGSGSTFTVVIPKAQLRPNSTNAPTQPIKSDAPPGLKIVLADDNRDAAHSLGMILQVEGHEVHLAHDGAEALATIRNVSPDAALLDIGMPQMSGFEVASHVRAEGNAMALIAITGWGQTTDREKSAASGFDHHLTKPVDSAELLRILEKVERRATETVGA
ncbi:MAG TPA: ATP-binding protein [Steroidobacteraceae bacterium]|nr:ATP-binding protein [Steroidobacteraceae bacterium]